MATAKQVKTSFKFTKGIITEASPLTFPENASVDEQNFDLNIDGSRSRRLGVNFEQSYSYINTSYQSTSDISNTIIEEFRWDNVNNSSATSILIVRFGSDIKFFDLFEDSQSNNEILFDSTFYQNNDTTKSILFSIGENNASYSEVNGKLLITVGNSKYIYILSYDGTTISGKYEDIRVRDLWGIDDLLEVSERPSLISKDHSYNIRNQGWIDSKINLFVNKDIAVWRYGTYYNIGDVVLPDITNGYTYKAETAGLSGSTDITWPTSIDSAVTDGTTTWVNIGSDSSKKYPSNADIISLGEKTDGGWDRDLLKSYLIGNTPAPKGKYIISFFDRSVSREEESLVTGLTQDVTINYGVTASASYAGRLFISGINGSQQESTGDNRSPNVSGYLLFSKIVKSDIDYGKFYQEADPTSDNINELIDTDGGYVIIPEAQNIHKLEQIGDSLMVFAENGVWQLRGGDAGFKATDYNISKISPIGSISPRTIVNAEGVLFYFSKSGIYGIQIDKTQTNYSSQSLSKDTIQKLYLNINSLSKLNSKGYYSSEERKVRWLYSNLGNNGYTYDNELIFDLNVGAFYKYNYSLISATSPIICGLYSTPNFNNETEIVIDSSGVSVTDSLGNNVISSTKVRTSSITKRKYITLEKPLSGFYKYTFNTVSDTNFKDWYSWDSIGLDAKAYLVTGYDISGDSMRYKQVPYISFHFNRTEKGFDSNFNAIDESSCLVTPYWDFSDHINSGKIGKQFQAYKLKRNYIPDSGSFDYGQSVITTKSKLRGRGRALSLKIETELGKNCHLLGWSLFITGTTDI